MMSRKGRGPGMTRAGGRYTFRFDSSSCSGCKACQVACKDRNHLPAGVLWRRVYEVTGGGWTRDGAAWKNDVFAYHLSVACNHCVEAICVEVCPSGAMVRRDDGVVLLEDARCLGCRLCSWACPYGAPQYDPSRGRMTKCTLCVENLEEGKPPSCVAACPMRALELDRSEDEGAADPYPLPDRRLTRPSIIVQAHPDAVRAGRGTAGVGNGEEVGFS
jgi:anaerobic dimethyl sulfoxide reductase subunit B